MDPFFGYASADAEDYNLGNLPVSPEPFPVAAHAATCSTGPSTHSLLSSPPISTAQP
jgi:hypothetical protein